MNQFYILLIFAIYANALYLPLFGQKVNAMSLESVVVSPVVNFESYFVVPTHDGNCAGLIVNNINNNLVSSQFADLPQDFINKISNEISLAIGLPDTNIHHMRWELSITPQVGSLKIFSVNAQINGNNVHVNGRMLNLVQPIPPFYEPKQVCARSGSRRFGIAGPRAMECYIHNVARGINQNEINHITNVLINKANEVKGTIAY